MGVEYCHYLIPRPNSFRPSVVQLVGLVESLATGHWIAAPESEALREMASIDQIPYEEAVQSWALVWPDFAPAPRSLTSEWFEHQMTNDLRLGFPVRHAERIGLIYPLINDAGPPEDPYYEIELQVSRDYVHRASEVIEPIMPVCSCGEPLDYDADDDVFYASRIKMRCPRCSAVFDPSSIRVVVRDGWSGEQSFVDGGGTSRFAIAVECGKCIPSRRHVPIRANPALIELCQAVLGHELYQIGDVH